MGSIAIAGGGGSGRTLLSADKNYHVETTGSDTTGIGSVAKPWKTLQHAMDFISANLDFAGFNVIVNIGTGTFVGVGYKSCVGGGILLFTGAGVGNTIVADGPNDGNYNAGESFSIYFKGDTAKVAVDQMTIDNAGGFDQPTIIVAAPGMQFNLGNPITFAPAATAFTGTPQGFIEVNFGSLVVINGGSHTLPGGVSVDYLFLIQGSANLFDIGTWTVPAGTLTVVLGYCSVGSFSTGGSYQNAGASHTGTVSGPRYRLISGGAINSGAGGPTLFPGSVNGSIQGGFYDQNIFTVANLPDPTNSEGETVLVTDSTVSLAAGLGNIVAGGAGNIVPVYCDGTNWRIG